MTYDARKLSSFLEALELGGMGAKAAYGAYLDGLPGQFGAPKLADEADLILAALAASELLHAEALKMEAPVAFTATNDWSDGMPRFFSTRFAPVGGMDEDWLGVPLEVLAEVLQRSRARVGRDDEVYSASFVYVLFRLKAALGVWRGDGGSSASYRLWLKDLAPIIAEHPRLSSKVALARTRIAQAFFAEVEALSAGLENDERPVPSLLFKTYAPVAALLQPAEEWSSSSAVLLWDLGNQANQAADHRWAILLFSSILRVLSVVYRFQSVVTGAACLASDCAVAALAYMLRGNAKADAIGYGASTAIDDYNLAIRLLEDLRENLQEELWSSDLRHSLAKSYANRGNAKQDATGYGPTAAIEDYDRAIRMLEDLWDSLGEARWDPPLRENLARAYMNRGNAKQDATGYGPSAAIEDYDRAIRILEDLRDSLVEELWASDLRATLAKSYAGRGSAKRDTASHGSSAAIEDFDRAITIWEDLRDSLGEALCPPELREDLAGGYVNRGIAKTSARDHGPSAAIEDYDRAIRIREDLSDSLGPACWGPPLREGLALAYVNRGNAKQSANGHGRSAAIDDYDRAIHILEDMKDSHGTASWDLSTRKCLVTAYTNMALCFVNDPSEDIIHNVKYLDGAISIIGEILDENRAIIMEFLFFDAVLIFWCRSIAHILVGEYRFARRVAIKAQDLVREAIVFESQPPSWWQEAQSSLATIVKIYAEE